MSPFLQRPVAACGSLTLSTFPTTYASRPTRRKEAGLPIVFGVNYAAIRYLKEHNIVSAEAAAELEEGKITDVQRPALRSSQTI